LLSLLGACTVAALLLLILFRLTSVLVALTLVPVAAALIGGFGGQLGQFAMDGILNVTPTAVLLAFAVIYFGIMNDAGLFGPIIGLLVRGVASDPVRIAVGTAAIATVAHLDGAGASTFMVTVPAMLPLYKRVGMSPLALTCTTALAAGTMNMLPWGGPAARAAAALQVNMGELFPPVIPAMLVGMAGVFLFAIRIGRLERARIAKASALVGAGVMVDSIGAAQMPDLTPPRRTTRLWRINAGLTAVTLAALFTELVPLAVVFMIASAVALVVNSPGAQAQLEQLTGHGAAAMMMVTTVFAAGVFTGVLTKSGMLDAMATDLVAFLPASALRHLPSAMAVASMPLSLVFDPDSFYFGLLPILARAADAAGGSSIELGRAALLGQMTTGFPVSVLTPATFLLVGLAGVDMADHQRRTIPYAFGITVLMTVAALATRALTL
jgi:CitMHS family citrate-Mg2+:H+ or citrate-Ca2+:H+ symporter